jgi:hypothetical protein
MKFLKSYSGFFLGCFFSFFFQLDNFFFLKKVEIWLIGIRSLLEKLKFSFWTILNGLFFLSLLSYF